jgi:hypothetical protein
LPDYPEYDGVVRSRSHRLHIRVPAVLAADLLARAAAGGLTVSATARQLIQLGLKVGVGPQADAQDHGIVALAALVAAEHASLMVASVLPDGERRMHELGELAAAAAEERLALFREAAR